MKKARSNRVQVDYELIEKRMRVLGIAKAAISKQLGYTAPWFVTVKNSGRWIREKDAKDICELLGLKLEDVIVPEKQPEPEPEQPETGDADAIKLTTPIAIDQADVIVTGLADIVSEAVNNQTKDIIERMDALAAAVVQLAGEVKREQDFTHGCAVYLREILEKMEELKN